MYARDCLPRFAKVFRSGNSQAVRLPKDFRFDVEEVEVSREGDAVILRPRRDASAQWASLRAAVDRGFSADFMAEGRQQSDNQKRPELDDVFD
jgi:antitoxin VapB